MRSQYRKINSGNPSRVPRRFFADVRVINDVARQKTSRGNHSRDHARHVPAPCAMPDEVPPIEMKTVLIKLSDALRAGRSEIEITLKRLNR